MARDCTEEYVTNFLTENSDLRRKLQSKAEALLILSKELDQCRTERDQFKLMAEQLQDRYSILKKKTHDMGFSKLSLYSDGMEHNPGSTLLQVLGETKELNKALKIELEDLRQKLRDAQGDIKVLRNKLNHQETSIKGGSCDSQPFSLHQKEELVQQLETLNLKFTQMTSDLQAVIDEKEDLVTERDAYKCKVHRLNYELNTLLKGDGKKLIDIDSLVMENRYVQERLHQVEEEKEMANQALVKYKSMLEKKRNKGSVKFGTNNNTGMVMSHKQVQQLLERGTVAQLPNTAATLSDMKSLCQALLETVGDKSLALTHQKKANRILATRISELEQRLEAMQGGKVAVFPSQLLLDGYSSADVDRMVERMLPTDNSDSDDINVAPRDSKQDRDVVVHEPPTSSEKSMLSSATESSDKALHSKETCVQSKNESFQGKFDDVLPPQLRQMVEKALEDIRLESKSSTHSQQNKY